MRLRRQRRGAPRRRSSGRSRPPRAPRRRASSSVLPPSRCSSAISAPRAASQQIGGALEHRGARRRPASRPRPRNRCAACALRRHRLGTCRRAPSIGETRRARDCAPSTAARFGARCTSRQQARRGSRDRRTRRRPSCAAPARRDRAAAGCADGARARHRRSRPAAACRIVVDRHRRIGGDRDERRVGAVLQQPPHQIGEQVAMAADRRIDPAGRARHLGEQRLVQRLAHAVQALEFVAFDAARLLDHARDGQRVVGGELRIEPRPRRAAACARRPCRTDRSSPCG